MDAARNTLTNQINCNIIDDLTNWLLDSTLHEAEVSTLVTECCERLRESGVPLSRVFFSYSVLHPLFSSKSVAWKHDSSLNHESYEHGAEESDDWLESPFFHMVENNLDFLRRRLIGDDAKIDFPILKGFHKKGSTDYLAFSINLGHVENKPKGILGSWSTQAEGGFTDDHISVLKGIQRYLSAACNMAIKTQISKNVATAYLGITAGLEVLDGRIRRGDYNTIRAVIWLSDMRDSTQLTEKNSSEDYLTLLNKYFECTAGTLMEEGGQVLSFIGDAVLGIFPVGVGGYTEAEASQRAISAAKKAQALCGASEADPRYGIALHFGDVMFGNIGVPNRLSFSVIGSAVNEVSRLESLTKELKQPILVTGQFAKNLNIEWQAMGDHALRGVSEPITAYAPP
jgi:adenylate cyclase